MNFESLKEENISLQAENKIHKERLEMLNKRLQTAEEIAEASNWNAMFANQSAYQAHISAADSSRSASCASWIASMRSGFMQAPTCEFLFKCFMHAQFCMSLV